jgi:hypothetical protein
MYLIFLEKVIAKNENLQEVRTKEKLKNKLCEIQKKVTNYTYTTSFRISKYTNMLVSNID